jgi:hypothetical protein
MAELKLDSTFVVSIPKAYYREIEWLLLWIFGRLNNFTYQCEVADASNVIFSFEGKRLVLPQTFFPKAKNNWLSKESLPKSKLDEWQIKWTELENNLIKPSLPLLYGEEGFYKLTESEYTLKLDILGSCFFLLTRYEEFIDPKIDKHSRFVSSQSVAFKSGFLERPLADEYIEVLFTSMKKIWSNLNFDYKQFNFQISHDVDVPALYAFKKFKSFVRVIACNLVRGNFTKAREISLIWMNSRAKINPLDPFNTFNWIMNLVESANSRSTFYFLTGRHNKLYDGEYEIDHPAIVQLITDIYRRGHQIGLHPSYDAALNFDILADEQSKLNQLKRKIVKSGVSHGARMHYLRWLGPQTWQAMANNGLQHDASLGFAEHVGFRCGTCHPFQAYDVINNRPIDILVRPLTVMEVSVIDNVYMALGTGEEAFLRIDKVRQACKKVNGVFTLLWHNSRLVKEDERALFKRIVQTM